MPRNKRFVDFRAAKAAVPMQQVLDQYRFTSKLTRTGGILGGPCPIHGGNEAEHFVVAIRHDSWICVGFKNGGSILDFVSLKESLTIRAAALLICCWFDLVQND